MPVDLHTHSTASDGSDPPGTVVAKAAGVGLAAIALTDHDTLEGILAARAAAGRHGLELVAGTELSVEWPAGTMHMLCYFLDPDRPGPLQERLAEVREARDGRNRRMVAKLRDLGCDITWEEVAAESQGGVVGRPHLAAVLVAKGYAESVPDAFERFLASGRPGYVDRYRLAWREAARLAAEEGAVPVVAHPHTLGVGATDYAAAFTELAAGGVRGIEAHYGEYDPELRAHLAGIAARLGVVATGGSDYHGTYKPQVALGSGRGDLVVPDAALDALRAARDLL